MLTQFRTQYPYGGLISELITIDRGQYIVKVTLQVEGIALSTGLAAADKVETAEDYARERALLALALDTNPNRSTSVATVTNHVDTAINKPSNLVNLPFKQESTTSRQVSIKENTVEQVQPLPINTTMASSVSSVAKVDSGVNNHLVESSPPTHSVTSSLPEIEPTDFNSSPPDLNLSSQELPSQTSPAKLDTAQPETPLNPTLETIEFDFNEIKNRTDVEIKRLGWTKEQGRDFLLQTYGKRSRLHLTDQELMDFLGYLESQTN